MQCAACGGAGHQSRSSCASCHGAGVVISTERMRVKIPEGVDDAKVRGRLLKEFGIEIGGGLGTLKGKVWRIGLMGVNSRPNNVLLLLAALERILPSEGFACGSGIAAANAVYAQG
jgi:alanine-glyoxylate transaminase/serine-glyoxylate transaminase/serine-pyruvate transaminase